MINKTTTRKVSGHTSIVTTSHHWESLNFITISRGGKLIHLAFSETMHLQALAFLEHTESPGPIIKDPHPDAQQTRRFILNLLISSETSGEEVNFRDNPFLRRGTLFQQQIWRLLQKIPPGKTITYGELAVAAGYPGGSRAVGQACHVNPLGLIIPCHRVVGFRDIGGFAGGKEAKAQLLALEKTLLGGVNHPGDTEDDQQ